jgi:multiple sugar transport system substrate-binding protein
MSVIQLRGMTWDHPRGVDPLVACCGELGPELGISVAWDARSLEDFEAFPLDELARQYDLMVIDHPHAGMAAASGCLRPFDESLAVSLRGSAVGGSHESYFWQGRQWALAIDAAAQVSARRQGSGVDWPATFDEVLALARDGRVLWPLAPVHALMSFFTLTANAGAPCAIEGDRLVTDRAAASRVLGRMRELAAAVPAECFAMNPIRVFERLVTDTRFTYAPLIYGYVSYARANFRPTRIEFADIPALDAAHGPRGSTLGGTGVAVSALSKHADVAQQLAIRLASADVQRGTYARAGGQPAHRAAWTDAAVNDETNGFYANTLATLDAAYLRPRFNGYIAFQQRAGEIVSAALRGTATITSSLNALDAAFRDAQRENSR